MVNSDSELASTQEYIARLQKMLAIMRKSETPENYAVFSQSYQAEIEKKQAEIREYLSRVADPAEAA